jgi:hypothetical protein
MYRHSKENWVPDFLKRRPDVSLDTLEHYLHNLYAVQPDFLYSVSRDFMRTCPTPILVLPDDIPSHPLQTSIDVASLAPNAEITVYPWKEPAELKQRTIARVRRFLQAHVPRRAAAHERKPSGGCPRDHARMGGGARLSSDVSESKRRGNVNGLRAMYRSVSECISVDGVWYAVPPRKGGTTSGQCAMHGGAGPSHGVPGCDQRDA